MAQRALRTLKIGPTAPAGAIPLDRDEKRLVMEASSAANVSHRVPV